MIAELRGTVYSLLYDREADTEQEAKRTLDQTAFSSLPTDLVDDHFDMSWKEAK
jgi:hypothetical protein